MDALVCTYQSGAMSHPGLVRDAHPAAAKKRRCLWHRRSLGRKRPRKQWAVARLRGKEWLLRALDASGFLLRRSI